MSGNVDLASSDRPEVSSISIETVRCRMLVNKLGASRDFCHRIAPRRPLKSRGQ
jgi:hypothetical protein